MWEILGEVLKNNAFVYILLYAFNFEYQNLHSSSVILHVRVALKSQCLFVLGVKPFPVNQNVHDDVIKWKHFPRHWLFVRGVHWSPVNSPNKGQWRGALMFSLICVWINGWVNNREVGDLIRHRAHYDVIVNTSIYIVFSRYSIFYFMQAVYESVTRKNRVPYIVNTTVENWKNHIEYTCKKLSKCIGILSKARRKLQKSSLISLYHSFAFPYFIYCNHVSPGKYLSDKFE